MSTHYIITVYIIMHCLLLMGTMQEYHSPFNDKLTVSCISSSSLQRSTEYTSRKAWCGKCISLLTKTTVHTSKWHSDQFFHQILLQVFNMNHEHDAAIYSYYRIISNLGAAPIKAPPKAYPIYSSSMLKCGSNFKMHVT